MLAGFGICVSVLAQTSGVPRSAFYVGVGGGYNSVNFGTQNVYAIGTSNVFQDGVLVATGSAAGPGTRQHAKRIDIRAVAAGRLFPALPE